MRRLILATIAYALISGCGSGRASISRYTITDLGPGDGLATAAVAINNGGDIAVGPFELVCGAGGRSCPPEDAWLLSSEVGHSLGNVTIMDLNDRAEMVLLEDGQSWYWSGGQRRQIADPNGYQFVQAEGLNNSAEVVFVTPAEYTQSYVWKDGVSRRLAPQLADVSVYAHDINDRGHVAGTVLLGGSNGARGALMRDGEVLLLGTLGGQSSFGETLNERDQVIGYSEHPSKDWSGIEQRHAFLWDHGNIHDLGTLGGDYSRAFDINERGEIVGIARNAQRRDHACLWRDDRAIDLNTLIPAGSGWELKAARGINDREEIVGDGSLNGQGRIFVLRPE